MICKNCGKDNIAEAMFCENCGTKLEAEAPVAAPVAAPVEAPAPVAAPAPAPESYAAPLTMATEPPKKKKGKGKLILIIAIIVVLLAGIGVFGWFGFCAEEPWFVDESIIGLGGGAAAPVEDDSKDKEEVTKLVEDYIAEAKDYDIDNANKFLTEEQDNLFGGGAEEFKEETIEECETTGAEDFCCGLIDKWAESREMSVKEVKKDGDKYICTVEIKQIDEEEIEEILSEVLTNQEDARVEILEEAYEEGWPEEDEDGDFTSETIDKLNAKLVEYYEEKFSEEIEALEPVTTETKIVVVEVDGEWKIDADESELY